MSSGDGVVAVYPNDPSLSLSGSAWSTVSDSNVTLAFADGTAKGTLKFTGKLLMAPLERNPRSATGRHPGSSSRRSRDRAARNVHLLYRRGILTVLHKSVWSVQWGRWGRILCL